MQAVGGFGQELGEAGAWAAGFTSADVMCLAVSPLAAASLSKL